MTTTARTRVRSSLVAGLVLLTTALLVSCSSSGPASPGSTGPTGSAGSVAAAPSSPARSTVFSEGQAGADGYRIPSAGVTPNGTVVVTAEQRTASASDDDPHGLVSRRSTDQGRTWTDLVSVAPVDQGRGCSPSDPVTLTPTTGAAAGDVIVVFRPCREAHGLQFVRSRDQGATWSAPADLQLDRGSALTEAQALALRPGPGHGIELRAGRPGRLALVADTSMGSAEPKVLTVLLSDDGGGTWHAGATYRVPAGGAVPDESALAAQADGTIVISSRSAEVAPARLQLAASPDGETLLEVAPGLPAAPTTGVDSTEIEGSLLTLPDGQVILSTLSDPSIRRGLRLHRQGPGTSWTSGPLVHAGPAAYSDLVLLDPQTIGVVAEIGDRQPYERIELIPVPVREVGGPAEPLPPAAPRASYASGRLLVDGTPHRITSFCLVSPELKVDGGSIAVDISGGLGAVKLAGTVEQDGKAVDFSGTVPVQVDGRLYRGTLPGADGTPHEIDLVLAYAVGC